LNLSGHLQIPAVDQIVPVLGVDPFLEAATPQLVNFEDNARYAIVFMSGCS